MKAIIAFCALLASFPVSAQQIHRWVDADGRVQYSDKPPPGVASKPAVSRPEIKMVGTQRMTGFSEEGLAQLLKAAGY